MWLKQLPILYYLIPAISLALLIRWKCRSFRLFAAFVFVGVFLHETLHLITGAFLVLMWISAFRSNAQLTNGLPRRLPEAGAA